MEQNEYLSILDRINTAKDALSVRLTELENAGAARGIGPNGELYDELAEADDHLRRARMSLRRAMKLER